jgi:hypothetical protein
MRRSLLGACVVLALVMIGAGGGGRGGVLLEWARYSPPADVIAPADLQMLAARTVVSLPVTAAGGGEDLIFAFGDIPALRNVLFALLEEVLGGLEGLGDLLPLQAAKTPTDADLVALMRQAVTVKSVSPQQAEPTDTFFDWTDPDTAVHWTGRVLEQDDRLVPQLHGVGPETNCTINLTVLLELGSRLQLTGSIQGPIVADVYETNPAQEDWAVTPGRAILDADVDLLANAIAGAAPNFSARTHLAGDFQVPDGATWRTVNQGEATVEAQGTLGDVANLEVTGTIRRGLTMGPGLYWWQHAFEAALVMSDLGSLLPLQGDGEETPGNSVTFNDAVTFSDGMSGDLQIPLTEEEMTLTGALRARGGVVLGTIDLGDAGVPTIHWADGTSDELI